MLTFDSDDNDDKLTLEGDDPDNESSLPKNSIPAKNPFAPPQQTHSPMVNSGNTLPKRPESPFAPNPVESSKPTPVLPQNPQKRFLPPVKEDQNVHQEISAQPRTVAQPTPSYLPPVPSTPEPVYVPPVSQSPAEDIASQFMQSLVDSNPQENQRADQPAPVQLQQQLPASKQVIEEPVMVEATLTAKERMSSTTRKSKGKALRSNKEVKEKTPKGEKKAKPEKEKSYAGERKKILYIRLIAGAVAVIVGVAGIQAIFLPSSGPTVTQVQSAAKKAVNFTGFPTISGEQFAIDFSRAYFNFESKDTERSVSLARFASPDLVKAIDIQVLSAQEFEATKKGTGTYNDYLVSQSIDYGPYVVAANNLDPENAIFTVKIGLKSKTVVYLNVPVKYDPKTFAMTLAGPPSFTKPIQNQGSTKAEEYTSNFGSGDAEIQKDFKADLEAYLSAWALSDTTIINRYLVDGATDDSKQGLQGAVKLVKVDEFLVEPADEAKPSTATSRKVEIKVTWEDPKTNLRYPQQYRMLIAKNAEGKWAIFDIQNFSVLNK